MHKLVSTGHSALRVAAGAIPLAIAVGMVLTRPEDNVIFTIALIAVWVAAFSALLGTWILRRGSEAAHVAEWAAAGILTGVAVPTMLSFGANVLGAAGILVIDSWSTSRTFRHATVNWYRILVAMACVSVTVSLFVWTSIWS